MNLFRKYVTASLLSAALLIPAGVIAANAATPQDVNVPPPHEAKKDAKKAKSLRVYDAKHNIYHDWTAQEDAAYRSYLEQQHEQYRAYQQLNADQQAAYWDWRASHPDVPAPASPPNGY